VLKAANSCPKDKAMLSLGCEEKQIGVGALCGPWRPCRGFLVSVILSSVCGTATPAL
jgi:hypothetical protein